MLEPAEIYKLVNDYIGVFSGYLGDFSYRTHQEFYPSYCNLDINPDNYQGTTKQRFIAILESSDALTQSKILKGILTKYPVSYFPDEQRERKQALFDEFKSAIARLNSVNAEETGVKGDFRNLIFACNSRKPEIIITDSINNQIEIINDDGSCLIYNLPISEKGLTWESLIEWWSYKNKLPYPEHNTEQSLLARLKESITSPPEILLFHTYFGLSPNFGKNFPALVPQVYLHYDPKTLKELQGTRRIERQRMDFLILFSNKDRVVIEVDGKQHYAENDTASPKKYAEMVAADRKLRLAGYEIYRFGGYELQTHKGGERLVKEFFVQLLQKHGVKVGEN